MIHKPYMPPPNVVIPKFDPELRIGIKRYNKTFWRRFKEWCRNIFDAAREFPAKSDTCCVLLKPGDDGYEDSGFVAVHDKQPFGVMPNK